MHLAAPAVLAALDTRQVRFNPANSGAGVIVGMHVRGTAAAMRSQSSQIGGT